MPDAVGDDTLEHVQDEVALLSAHFSGTLRYSVSGTAEQGIDYETSDSISVDGVYVNLPVSIMDDDKMEDRAETIVLTLHYDMNEDWGYVPGTSVDHTIYIYDNDALWNGSIENNGTALHFQMKIIQSPSGTSGALVTDGHGIIPLNGSDTEWPAHSLVLDKASFDATVDQLLVKQQRFGGISSMIRKSP